MELFKASDVANEKPWDRPCHICQVDHGNRFLCSTCWMKVNHKNNSPSRKEEKQFIQDINRYIVNLLNPEINSILLDFEHGTV